MVPSPPDIEAISDSIEIPVMEESEDDGNGIPVEDSPAVDIPVDNGPVEESPVEDSSAEDRPLEDSPPEPAEGLGRRSGADGVDASSSSGGLGPGVIATMVVSMGVALGVGLV